MIRKGAFVRVVDPNYCYRERPVDFIKLGFKNKRVNHRPTKGAYGVVLAVSFSKVAIDMLNGRQCLVHEKGLEILKKGFETPDVHISDYKFVIDSPTRGRFGCQYISKREVSNLLSVMGDRGLTVFLGHNPIPEQTLNNILLIMYLHGKKQKDGKQK